MAEDRMLSDEILLGLIKANSGGGGGGTSNYNDLSNKPQIGGVTLSGNKSASDLGLVAAVDGKGLSTNDYTDADKAIVGGVTAALAGKVDKVEGKGLSTNDFTDAYKTAIGDNTTAISGIKNGASINSFGGVETALEGKQAALTAGDYIAIDANNEIAVNREIPSVSASYELKTTSTSDPDINTDVIKRVNGEIVWTQNYNYQTVRDNPVTIDDVFVLSYSGQWKYKLLVASDDHAAGYEQTWGWSAWVDYTENFSLVDNTGKKLIIKSELDTALTSKQNATDNTLQTTDKTVVGAVNELKNGLTNVDVALSVPENTGKNELPTTLDWLKASNTVGTWDGNVYTKDDVTFTVATDSKGRISSITVNGTASGANTIIVLAAGQYDEWSGMILNGTPTNDSNYYIRIEKDGSPYTAYAVNIGGDTTISSGIVGNDVKAFIKVGQGKTANNAVFTPMIRDARITDPTYAPYIPSVESRIEAVESGLNDVNSDLTGIINQVGGIYVFRRNTSSSSVSAAFTYTGTRYAGLFFNISNSGKCSVYAVTYNNSGTTKSYLEKLAGDTLGSLVINNDNGNISFDMSNWSSCILIVSDNNFTVS